MDSLERAKLIGEILKLQLSPGTQHRAIDQMIYLSYTAGVDDAKEEFLKALKGEEADE